MISIVRDKLTHGTCLPEPLNILAELPDSIQHHVSHGLRPAPAIYNISLSPVHRAFNAVVTEIDRCEDSGVKDGDHIRFEPTKLLDAQSDLLLKMASHIDECYLVLKALQPPVEIKDPHIFTDRWLQQARHPTIANFKRDIESYQKHLIPLVNRIKHNQARLRSIVCSWPGVFLPGYFVEGSFPDGAVGPDSVIHPTGGAFSFSRDLRIHFAALHVIGRALAEASRKAIFKQQGFRVKPKPISTKENADKEHLDIARRLSKLPTFVYMDENPNDVPRIRVFENNSTTQLILGERTPRFGFPPGGCAVTTVAEGDGHTRRFKMPYMTGNVAPPPGSGGAPKGI